MEIKLNNQEIKKPLEVVKGGVENNSNHLILAFVLIKLKDKKLTLTTTNTEIEITTTVDILEDRTITFSVALNSIINILSKLKNDEDMVFKIEDNQINISTKNNNFKLNALKDSNFNKLIDDDEITQKFKFKTASLRQLINKTKFSIALDNPQKYLNGLFLAIDKKYIICASSDGHRLSVAKQEQEGQEDIDKKIIIPKKSVDEINKFLNENNSEFIDIDINENYFIISDKETTISTRLIDSKFPDYKNLIPLEFDNKIIINKKEFEHSLKQVEIFTKELKTIKMDFDNSKLTITTDSEKGSAKVELKINNFSNSLIADFNVSYLIQTIQHIDSENIIFNIDSKDIKVAVLESDEEANYYKYLIMAVKV